MAPRRGLTGAAVAGMLLAGAPPASAVDGVPQLDGVVIVPGSLTLRYEALSADHTSGRFWHDREFTVEGEVAGKDYTVISQVEYTMTTGCLNRAGRSARGFEETYEGSSMYHTTIVWDAGQRWELSPYHPIEAVDPRPWDVLPTNCPGPTVPGIVEWEPTRAWLEYQWSEDGELIEGTPVPIDADVVWANYAGG